MFKGENVYAFSPGAGALRVVQVGITSSTGIPVAQTANTKDWLTDYGTDAAGNIGYGDPNIAGAAARSVVDSGIDAAGLLSWGRWTDSTALINGTQIACCSASKSVHYIFGTPTANANIPMAGTATFSLIGSTSPTASDGSMAPGKLISGLLAVQWGGAGPATKVGMKLDGSIGGAAFQVLTPGGLTTVASSPVTYNATTQSFSGNWLALVGAPNASVSGFFAGTNASHAGLTYSAPVSPTVFVQGAAAFKR